MNWLERKKLFVVYNKAMSKALKSPDRVKIRERLRKALGIIQSSHYYKDDKAEYNPTYYSCNCKDWEFKNSRKRNYKGFCKHQMAVILMERVKTLSWQQTTFLVLSGAIQDSDKVSEFPGKIFVKEMA